MPSSARDFLPITPDSNRANEKETFLNLGGFRQAWSALLRRREPRGRRVRMLPSAGTSIADLAPRNLCIPFTASSKGVCNSLKTRSYVVESTMGAGADAVAPSRFPSPLIKPDVPISGIRLSEWFHRRLTNEAPTALSAAGRHPVLRRPWRTRIGCCHALAPYDASAGNVVHNHGRDDRSLRTHLGAYRS
jgi:hypothetical protein